MEMNPQQATKKCQNAYCQKGFVIVCMEHFGCKTEQRKNLRCENVIKNHHFERYELEMD